MPDNYTAASSVAATANGSAGSAQPVAAHGPARQQPVRVSDIIVDPKADDPFAPLLTASVEALEGKSKLSEDISPFNLPQNNSPHVEYVPYAEPARIEQKLPSYHAPAPPQPVAAQQPPVQLVNPAPVQQPVPQAVNPTAPQAVSPQSPANPVVPGAVPRMAGMSAPIKVATQSAPVVRPQAQAAPVLASPVDRPVPPMAPAVTPPKPVVAPSQSQPATVQPAAQPQPQVDLKPPAVQPPAPASAALPQLQPKPVLPVATAPLSKPAQPVVASPMTVTPKPARSPSPVVDSFVRPAPPKASPEPDAAPIPAVISEAAPPKKQSKRRSIHPTMIYSNGTRAVWQARRSTRVLYLFALVGFAMVIIGVAMYWYSVGSPTHLNDLPITKG